MKYILIFLRKGILYMIFCRVNTLDILGMYDKYQIIVFCRITADKFIFLETSKQDVLKI